MDQPPVGSLAVDEQNATIRPQSPGNSNAGPRTRGCARRPVPRLAYAWRARTSLPRAYPVLQRPSGTPGSAPRSDKCIKRPRACASWGMPRRWSARRPDRALVGRVEIEGCEVHRLHSDYPAALSRLGGAPQQARARAPARPAGGVEPRRRPQPPDPHAPFLRRADRSAARRRGGGVHGPRLDDVLLPEALVLPRRRTASLARQGLPGALAEVHSLPALSLPPRAQRSHPRGARAGRASLHGRLRRARRGHRRQRHPRRPHRAQRPQAARGSFPRPRRWRPSVSASGSRGSKSSPWAVACTS